MTTRSSLGTKYISLSNPVFDEISKIIRKEYPDSCILSVEEVVNDNLTARFLDLNGDKKPLKLFHGTKEQNIPGIVQEGFLVEKNVKSAYGKGTYTSPSVKVALGYTDNIVDKVSYVFYCDVYDGIKEVFKKDNSPHVDIVTSPDSLFYVIKKDQNILPRYIISFYKFMKP